MDNLFTYLESLVGEGSAEVGMGILRVLLNDNCKVFNCSCMILYHLVRLRTLMDVPNVTRVSLYALNSSYKWRIQSVTSEKGKMDFSNFS